MKTIVFHSYKGGVGRTLALSNLGVALSRIHKRVLIMDWDFDAPGLAIKFGIEHEVEKGYVDYLYDIKSVSTKIQHTNLVYRGKYLKSCIKKIKKEKNIYLLPAGDRSNKSYWSKISTRPFQEYFDYSNSDQYDINTSFFEEELRLLEKCFDDEKFDYLLIDCKTGNERAVIPLMLLADHVVELFNCNNEGIFGELHIRSAISRLRKENPDKIIELTSTMTRVPATFTKRHALREYEKFASSMIDIIDIEPNDQAKELFLIHEHQELETAEKLKFNGEDNNDIITHDYIELFEYLFKDDSLIKKELETLEVPSWKAVLGVAAEVEIIERYFNLYLPNGELLNTDKQRNVALNCNTLKEMLDSLAEHQRIIFKNEGVEDNIITEKIQKTFNASGYAAGKGFGLQAVQPGNVWSQIPNELEIRLNDWLRFDMEAGFGNWNAELNESQKEVAITGINNSFVSNSEFGYYFVIGYLQGVLSYLIPGEDDPANIIVKSTADNHIRFSYL